MTRLTCDNVRDYAFLIRHERLDPVVANEVAEHCCALRGVFCVCGSPG